MRWLPDRTVAHLRRVAEWPDLADTKYRLLEELGRGGMGTVYLAEDTVLGRKVALKVIATGAGDTQTADRMLREARIIARLEHPGIVPVHDAGALPDGRIFYAMKRVEGERLDAVTAPLPDRLRIFQQICEAVAFAHAHGVLHRDLKPENVMVGSFGEVLVMDWGVAKLLDAAAERASDRESDASASQTAEGTVVGTLSYMAPEQADARTDDISPRTDVYALGAILYYLLARRPPFEGEAAQRRVRGEAAASPVPLRRFEPSIPRPLEAIVAKAMAADPALRYASAEDLAAEVGRFLGGEPVRAYRERPWERAARVFARYRTPILLVAAYLLMRTLVILFARP